MQVKEAKLDAKEQKDKDRMLCTFNSFTNRTSLECTHWI